MKSSSQKRLSSTPESKAILWGAVCIVLIILYFVGRTLWQFRAQEQQSYDRLLTDTSSRSTAPTITATSLQKLIRTPGENFLLIDIRPQTDYLISHIPTALSYPNDTVSTLSFNGVEKVILIGSTTSTGENETVIQILEDKNIPFAFLEGGQLAWEQLNEQVVTTGDPTSIVDQSKLRYVTPTTLKQRFQNGEKFFVLDVQTKANYQKKRLQGAVNIPLAELEGRINEVPAGDKVVVYGSTDYEAFQAGITLFDLNILTAEVISGQDVLNNASGLFVEESGS